MMFIVIEFNNIHTNSNFKNNVTYSSFSQTERTVTRSCFVIGTNSLQANNIYKGFLRQTLGTEVLV